MTDKIKKELLGLLFCALGCNGQICDVTMAKN